MKINYPKIQSEKQLQAYLARRQSLGNLSSIVIRAHNHEIDMITMRIVEWNCRNDDHNPVLSAHKTPRQCL